MVKPDPYVNDAFRAAHVRAQEEDDAIVEREAIQTGGAEPTQEQWPALRDEALYGLAGQFVKTIAPHSESDPAALLVQFLTCFGNAVGRSPHFEVEADEHHANLFVVLVGKTSSGKGMSFGRVRRIFRVVDDVWVKHNIVSNLASGEGLIHAVRDPIYKDAPTKDDPETSTRVLVDQGVGDKRLLVHESEFSSPLVISQRPGNTLSGLLRQAWETGDLSNVNKNSPERATDAHISIIGHITFGELQEHVNSVGAANGFANRFLWVAVRSSKDLPFGGGLADADLNPLASRIARALVAARAIAAMHRDDEANRVWATIYPQLKNQPEGMLGSICNRARPQVVRLSLLYALLDGSRVIRGEHLSAALAVWKYCAESARLIFGDATGDPVADKIAGALRSAASAGMTRTDISAFLGRHQTSDRIEIALNRLLDSGRIRHSPLRGGGARYFSC